MSSGAIVYSFTARYPPQGDCETQQGLGQPQPPMEPGNVAFCLLSCLFGIVGIIHSKPNMSATMIYLYALIIGYGIAKACAHAILMNGFDKIAETTILKILQALVTAGFAACLRSIRPFNHWPHWILGLVLSIAGIYPAVAMVVSSSIENPWVGWLTFDLIWAIVLTEVVIIWLNRDQYPVKQKAIFNLIWYATVSIIVAYIFWLIDTFACSPLVARLYLQGWWHIFLSLGFYHCVVLIAYFIAATYNYEPVATFWPSEKIILLATVTWEHHKTL